MFRPLAFTKTYALGAALSLSLVVIPTLAYTVFNIRVGNKRVVRLLNYILCAWRAYSYLFGVWPAIALTLVGLNNLFLRKNVLNVVITVAFMLYLLTANWLPLGPEAHFIPNTFFPES